MTILDNPLGIRNAQDKNFSITCGLDGYVSRYTKCSSFVSDMYRQHRDALTESGSMGMAVSETGALTSGGANYSDYSETNFYSSNEDGGESSFTKGVEQAVDQLLGVDLEHQLKHHKFANVLSRSL